MLPTTTPPTTIQILPGYRPGILGRTIEMHMDYYYPLAGWGHSFEAGLAAALGPFLKRLDDANKDPQVAKEEEEDDAVAAADGGNVKPSTRGRKNQVWAAIQVQNNKKERIVGVVYIDGDYYRFGEHKEEKGEEVCRLRCLIADDSVRGLGVGGKLFAAAMAFVKEEAGFQECRLTTSRQLEAARRLYERGGFVVVEEKKEEYVREDDGRKQIFERMQYVWRRDGGAAPEEEKKRADLTGTQVVVG
ncbi:hypothetical protein N0V85_004764 [Neurospora sp. IMI 360204]|nr:hypothetical protein N0V85_004764 [Neurospora sp. IMI 360204]